MTQDRGLSRRALLTTAAGMALVILSRGRTARAADAWPSKTVKLIVPFGPGGAVDIVGRLTARYLSDALKQQVVVENRSGRADRSAPNSSPRRRPTATPCCCTPYRRR